MRRILFCLIGLHFAVPSANGQAVQEAVDNAQVEQQAQQQSERLRAREAGVVVGIFPPGPFNAITDVDGVRVGHATVMEGGDAEDDANGGEGEMRDDDGRSAADAAVRTGVTAIVPPGGNIFHDPLPAAIYVGNGYGKLLGVTQVRELGEIETPILLTCTLCVWKAADAMVDTLLRRPDMQQVRSINPVVGETNDGYLSAIRQRPIRKNDVLAALRTASGGPVEEGSVGAGTGTTALGWKGGIGTSSRALADQMGGYTVGVLVQTNYGGVLSINGAPVGRELGRYAFKGDLGESGDGSIMIVVATDAPLLSRNLERLAKRALFGLARTGATMTNGSGDYVIAFSTTPKSEIDRPFENSNMSPLFQAVAEATEEAIYNSLFKATTVTGRDGHTAEALPIEQTLEILEAYDALHWDQKLPPGR